MIVKVLGYNNINFTDRSTGEVIDGKRVYYEILPEEGEANTAEYGNSCSEGFFRSCPPLVVGNLYGISFRTQKRDGRVSYVPSNLYPIPD